MAEKEVTKNIVEVTKNIVEEVKRINELLKSSAIGKLCEELYALAASLEESLERMIVHFAFRIEGGTIYVYDIFRASEPLELWSARIPETPNIVDALRGLVSSEEFRVELVRKILKTIAMLGKELAEKANVVRKVQELEERLREDP
jgi:hypothetical protein